MNQDDRDFIKGLTGEHLPPGALAGADQQSARTQDIALELVGLYLAFCDSMRLHDPMGTMVLHGMIFSRVRELVQQEDDREVICVVAQLCHLIFTMVLTRHDGDWDKLRAAAERGELFFDRSDIDPDTLAAFELGQQQ